MMKNDFDVPAALIRKYNQPVPGYTSYPTIPSWNEGLNIADWKNYYSVKQYDLMSRIFSLMTTIIAAGDAD